MFRHLGDALWPGGWLVAQCGGAGTIASILRAVDQVQPGLARGTYFAAPQETRRRLLAAGFENVEVWLQDEPTTFEAGEPFKTFLRTVVLREWLASIAPPEREAFVQSIVERLPEPVIHAVRLNISARRSGP